MRLKNLSKHCLLRFLCLNIKIYFTVCAMKRFKYCNTKLDHAELLSLREFALFAKVTNHSLNIYSDSNTAHPRCSLYYSQSTKFIILSLCYS